MPFNLCTNFRLRKGQKWLERMLFIQMFCLPAAPAQVTAKTLAQQEEQLKKMETISALQEAVRMLNAEKDKLEQEMQQAQAKVRLQCYIFDDVCPFNQNTRLPILYVLALDCIWGFTIFFLPELHLR